MAFCSHMLYNYISSVVIDEEKSVTVGSDHNFMIVNMNLPASRSTVQEKTSENIKKWNITEKTDWLQFKAKSKETFADWNADSFSNVNTMWNDFKDKLIVAGSKSVGMKQYRNKKSFWDKEISKLIKDRKKANRLFRIWSKHPSCSPDLLALLWEDYTEKKQRVAIKVKQNAINQKTKVIFENAAKASTTPRAYWNTLRRLNKSNDYPLKIDRYLDIYVLMSYTVLHQ